jgi:spore germination cell wall hydrolase CwlJ-like protein
MDNNYKPVIVIIIALAAVAAFTFYQRQQVQGEEKHPVNVGATIETFMEHPGNVSVAPVQQVSQNTETVSEWDEYELLCRCVEAEAGNQGLEGKRLVADVILNRVDDNSGMWPDDITGVISQKYQFTSYWDGGMERVEITEETRQAVDMEMKERGWPELYYFREGAWPDYGTPWKKVGAHYFSGK